MTRKKREERRLKAEDRKRRRAEENRRRKRKCRAARWAGVRARRASNVANSVDLLKVLGGEIGPADRRLPQDCRDFVADLRWIKRRQRDKFARLLAVAQARSPKIAGRGFWKSLLLVAKLSWKADPENWRPRGKSGYAVFRSLVDHLVVDYPVPRFLYDVFLDAPFLASGEALVGFFAYVAAGGSAYKYMNSAFIPAVMTRRMCHTFLHKPAGTFFFHALRASQVEALGGDHALARAICGTRLGRGFSSDERFWFTVIRWFCENPLGDNAQVAPVVDYIAEMRRRRPDYSMKGRTVKSLIRGMKAWHRELAHARYLRTKVFTPSGLKAVTWKVKSKDAPGDQEYVVWTMAEILTADELAKEGRTMRHCVYIYARLIVERRVSIWSLKCDGKRRLTVCVNRAKRAVVEARGKCNRMPEPGELARVARWARLNGLSMKL